MSAASPPQGAAKPSRRRTKVKDLIAQYHHDESLCRYKNKLCTNPRARKRRGGLHTFCEMHREAANRNQRRLDLRKRIQKRQLESLSIAELHGSAGLDGAVGTCGSPHSPASMLDAEMISPLSDASAVKTEPPHDPSAMELEPSSTPVALKAEDIYTLRWLFAVDETAKQQPPRPPQPTSVGWA